MKGLLIIFLTFSIFEFEIENCFSISEENIRSKTSYSLNSFKLVNFFLCGEGHVKKKINRNRSRFIIN